MPAELRVHAASCAPRTNSYCINEAHGGVCERDAERRQPEGQHLLCEVHPAGLRRCAAAARRCSAERPRLLMQADRPPPGLAPAQAAAATMHAAMVAGGRQPAARRLLARLRVRRPALPAHSQCGPPSRRGQLWTALATSCSTRTPATHMPCTCQGTALISFHPGSPDGVPQDEVLERR